MPGIVNAADPFIGSQAMWNERAEKARKLPDPLTEDDKVFMFEQSISDERISDIESKYYPYCKTIDRTFCAYTRTKEFDKKSEESALKIIELGLKLYFHEEGLKHKCIKPERRNNESQLL